jgi:fatty acid desaturase
MLNGYPPKSVQAQVLGYTVFFKTDSEERNVVVLIWILLVVCTVGAVGLGLIAAFFGWPEWVLPVLWIVLTTGGTIFYKLHQIEKRLSELEYRSRAPG